MARRHSRAHFSRPAPKTKVWIGAGVANAAIAGSATVLYSTLNAAALALRPFTILRTRLIISVTSDQITASEFVQGTFTKQVVTEAAAAAGVGSVPSGITEPDADYFVYMGFMAEFILSSAVGLFDNTGEGRNWVVDSKAMRKVGIDDQVVTIIENRVATGLLLAVEGRTLIQLH